MISIPAVMLAELYELLTSQRPSKKVSLSSQLHNSQCLLALVSGVVVGSGTAAFLAGERNNRK